MTAIPDEFWPAFENRLRELAAVWSPIAVGRLYPFLVSWLPAKMVEVALMRAVERGLLSIELVEIPRGRAPPEKVRFVKLPAAPAKPRLRIKAGSAP